MGTVTRVVTRSSHGNALHYGPTMFVEFENLSNPKVASYMTQFKWDFTSLPSCLFQTNKISIGSSPILPLVDILFCSIKTHSDYFWETCHTLSNSRNLDRP